MGTDKTKWGQTKQGGDRQNKVRTDKTKWGQTKQSGDRQNKVGTDKTKWGQTKQSGDRQNKVAYFETGQRHQSYRTTGIIHTASPAETPVVYLCRQFVWDGCRRRGQRGTRNSQTTDCTPVCFSLEAVCVWVEVNRQIGRDIQMEAD